MTRFGGQHLHDVSNASAAPAVSVHAYSPPLSAMRRYEMTDSGLALDAHRAGGDRLVTRLQHRRGARRRASAAGPTRAGARHSEAVTDWRAPGRHQAARTAPSRGRDPGCGHHRAQRARVALRPGIRGPACRGELRPACHRLLLRGLHLQPRCRVTAGPGRLAGDRPGRRIPRLAGSGPAGHGRGAVSATAAQPASASGQISAS